MVIQMLVPFFIIAVYVHPRLKAGDPWLEIACPMAHKEMKFLDFAVHVVGYLLCIMNFLSSWGKVKDEALVFEFLAKCKHVPFNMNDQKNTGVLIPEFEDAPMSPQAQMLSIAADIQELSFKVSLLALAALMYTSAALVDIVLNCLALHFIQDADNFLKPSQCHATITMEFGLWVDELANGFENEKPGYGPLYTSEAVTKFLQHEVDKPSVSVMGVDIPFDVPGARSFFKRRGSSSFNWPKYSMTVEAQDEEGLDKGITPIGLPRESDWILSGRRRRTRVGAAREGLPVALDDVRLLHEVRHGQARR